MSSPDPLPPALRRGSAARRLGAWLGVRRTMVVDGVRYRERSGESYRRAISPRGAGHKDYDVRFASGDHMRIRLSPERPYADLIGPSEPPFAGPVEPYLRPGARALLIPSYTGHGAAWLAARIGRYGGVVAISSDPESVRFARRRYALPGVAFERGGIESLAGEANGAFDIVIDPSETEGGAHNERTDELWRVLAHGGVLVSALAPARGEPLAKDDVSGLRVTRKTTGSG